MLYQRKHYNRRGQLFDIRLGTDGSSAWDVEDPQVWQWANGSWNRGAIRLFYSAGLNDYSGPNPAQADNNGNIHRMDRFVPNALDAGGNITSWVMGTDAYLYDELNRLTQVTETPTGGTGPGYTQKFIYDRWGNRRIDLAGTSTVGGGVTRIDFKVLTANNRLVAATDTTGDETSGDQMRYDKAGNLVYDNYTPPVGQRGGMVYDAENRMTSAVNGYHLYRYDADGKRTRKLVTGSPELWLVYGVNGELVAEYDAVIPGGTLRKEYGYRGGQMLVVYDATMSGDNQLKWLVTDHLGSTRMLVNRSGGLCGAIERLDYLPFGEELASTIGHRNANCSGYGGGNSLRQKFTGKERDNETGLDYFEVRYYSSVQGRFASPDEFTGGPEELFNFVDDASDNPTLYANPVEPQSFNKYQYSYNNPLAYNDPTGHCPKCIKAGAKTLIKSVAKGKLDLGEVYDAVDAVKTIADPSSTLLDKGISVFDIASPVSSKDIKWLAKLFGFGDKASDASKRVLRGSDNPVTAEAAAEGRMAHKEFAEKVKAKPGWLSEPALTDPATGKTVKPDAVTPSGHPIELKPNTPTGRAKGRRQLRAQESATGKKGRVVYYEPKKKKSEEE